MSKERARGKESYQNEKFLIELAPELLSLKGFESVRMERRRGMKFLVCVTSAGETATLWLKQGWSNTRLYSAIQFGMIHERSAPDSQPDSVFVELVRNLAENAMKRGATHVLLVHMYRSEVRHYVLLRIEDLVTAYRQQIRRWPKRARNTKIPTLYFVDSRDDPDAAMVDIVAELEVPLESVAGIATASPGADGPALTKITAEVERRLRQRAFRYRVGQRWGWRCAVTGTAVRDALEAAHLPGRDWRVANEATDGVLLRADLHRLLDRGIAEIDGDTFRIVDPARAGEYTAFDSTPLLSRRAS
jgi:hypothetical protein